ncbi:MAG: cysteine--tRNA ligase [Firmicutes bacterium]|nr:cysteine--tRNA ligase [Bacillota bacterium]
MKLYNTLTRSKDQFIPIDGKTARIYSCGPTVYSSPSIGNLRAYIFTDILKKAIELNGFEVFDIVNTTDVGHLQSDADEGEDKIEVAARKANLDPMAIAKRYTDEFFDACDKLMIRRPKITAPATSYIEQMIEHIAGLEKLGYTYNTSDGVYFDSSRFTDYYILSKKKDSKEDKAGIRVALGEKKNANDFCLWRFAKPTALQKWQSPWGIGFPGWHIECSAIARHHFGDTFDIHTGGVDHIPIHHTNEIAQTQALTNKPVANFWIHNEFVMVDGGKMSKSLGNVYTVTNLEERGFNPIAFRYFVLGAHYRTLLNFTFDALIGAQTSYDNLVKELSKHASRASTNNDKLAHQYRTRFVEYMSDDLNTSRALAIVWELVKLSPDKLVYDLVIEFDQVLSLGLENAVKQYLINTNVKIEIPKLVKEMADKRIQLKKDKQFADADKLREEIKYLGYEISDTKDGYEITKIN